MVLIYLHSGDCVEVLGAVEVETSHNRLLCLGDNDEELAAFYLSDVKAYATDEEHIRLIEEEVCDEDRTFTI